MDVYLDHNATAPLDPQAEAAMAAFGRDRFANPSSLHLPGRLAREALDAARARLAGAAGAPATWRLVFTSGGTEAISHAILALAFQRRSGHFVATAVEHAAVLHTLAWLETLGFSSTLVEVDADGAVDPRDVAAALRPETILVAVQLANNEVGTVQPVAAVAEAAQRQGVPVLVDGVQALGKLPVDVVRQGGDLWAFSGHKVGGPKGIGALLVRPGLELPPLLHGGGQEDGLRSGTENVAGAVGFSVAAERAVARQPELVRRWTSLRGELLAIGDTLPGVRVNGHPTRGLANTVSLSFAGVAPVEVVRCLAERGVAVSAGAACCGARGGSPVLGAMGRDGGAVRYSMGADTSLLDLRRAREVTVEVVRLLREQPRESGESACRLDP